MANPQRENGHIQIATEIWEALCRTRIPGEARQVLDFIIRKTWGWNKKMDFIPSSQFCHATGMKKPNVFRALARLTHMNLVIKNDTGAGVTYQFNKDYESWKPVSKTIPVSKKITNRYQKRYPSIDTTTDTKRYWSSTFDDRFWPRYPRKVKREVALRAWMRLKPSESLVATILQDIDKRLLSGEWNTSRMEFIPHPPSYINQRRWQDETIVTVQQPASVQVQENPMSRQKVSDILKQWKEED